MGGTDILGGLVGQGTWGWGPDHGPVMRMGAQGGAESQAQAGGQMAELGCQVGAWGEQQGLSSCLGSGLVPGNERRNGLSHIGEQAVPRPRQPRVGSGWPDCRGPEQQSACSGSAPNDVKPSSQRPVSSSERTAVLAAPPPDIWAKTSFSFPDSLPATGPGCREGGKPCPFSPSRLYLNALICSFSCIFGLFLGARCTR